MPPRSVVPGRRVKRKDLTATELDERIRQLTGVKSGRPVRPLRIRRILVATDGSKESVPALEWAREIARTFDAAVDVLAVAAPKTLYDATASPWAMPVHADTWFRRDAAAARRALNAAATRIRRANVKVTTHLKHGDPARLIIAFAKKRGSDVILVGSHGRNVLDRAVLGSVSDAVKNRSPVSVLIAKNRPRTSRILVATDGSQPSRRAALFGLNLAQQWNARTILFRALMPPTEFSALPAMEMDLPEVLRNQPDEDSNVQYTVAYGPTARAVAQEARRRDCGLIAMGSRGFGPVQRFLVGSVSNKVAHSAAASVLIVKDGR